MSYPSKFTPEARKAIVNSLKAGDFLEVAAAKAGVSARTAHEWMKRGGRGEKGYAEFLTDVEAANAHAESAYRGILNKAASEGTWQAAAWVMERRFPQRWQLKVREGVENEHRAFIEALRGELTSAEFGRVCEAVENIERRKRLALSVSATEIETEGVDV